jgi:predicted  nucleic acid-binding Zn-ribbon protein
MGSCEALEVVEKVQKMNYKKEVQEVMTQIRFTKNRLAGLTLEMDKEGRDPANLDEALEALDDVIDMLADFVEDE